MKYDVPKLQAFWDRRLMARDMRRRGMTYAAIARHLGVTNERARQIVCRADREVKYRKPPIERYVNG